MEHSHRLRYAREQIADADVTGASFGASAWMCQMPLSEILNVFGLLLDIIGFFVFFGLALPAVMRRDFVTSDRVDLDGVGTDSDQSARLMNPQRASLLDQRRRQRQTWLYYAAGLTVLFGFVLQIIASFVA